MTIMMIIIMIIMMTIMIIILIRLIMIMTRNNFCDGFCDGLKPRMIILYLLIKQFWWHKTYPKCFRFVWFWNSCCVHCWQRRLIGLQTELLEHIQTFKFIKIVWWKWLNWWQRCFWPEQSQGSLQLPQQDYPGWILSNSVLSFETDHVTTWKWSQKQLGRCVNGVIMIMTKISSVNWVIMQ